MRELAAEVVVIGTGMGGATTALALARRGVDVLILERGRRLPREPANWSPQAVFGDGHYRTAETWRDDAERDFVPAVHYVVGGNTKVYGASLPRLREHDFEAAAHEPYVAEVAARLHEQGLRPVPTRWDSTGARVARASAARRATASHAGWEPRATPRPARSIRPSPPGALAWPRESA